jgi:hypothetical protein
LSIVFTPKIPDFFIASTRKEKAVAANVTPKTKPKPARKRSQKREWTPEELSLLVELRALALPHTRCGLILKRRAGDCAQIVHKRQLQRAIQTKRKALIAGVLKENIT